MKNLANFLLFQSVWFAAVLPAADGSIWIGPLALAVFVSVHLGMVAANQRAAEMRYLALAGLLGGLADTVLAALGVTAYPSSADAWPYLVPPPWILSLWVAFAALPRFSLGWLRGRTLLAIVFGAIGGPLSYLGGARLGAVEVNAEPWITISGLAVEYAIATPLLLALSPAPPRDAADARPSGEPADETSADPSGQSAVPR